MPRGRPDTSETPTTLAASPFVKWAGGKGQLLAQLEPFFPSPTTYRRYFEPFLGGGAVFFHLQPRLAILSDLNEELINAYRIVRDQLDQLIASLRRHKDDEEYYYYVRGLPVRKLNPVRRASRFIFLNKRCYNGLYRVNKKGQFNVPKGKYRTPPRIFDERNLRNVSLALKDVKLAVGSYDAVLKEASRGDFVYLDPPYQPLSETAYFTAYTERSFKFDDQMALANLMRDLDKRGVSFLLNNHDVDTLLRLYAGFNIQRAVANRMINSRADRRKGISELIVTNYELPESPSEQWQAVALP